MSEEAWKAIAETWRRAAELAEQQEFYPDTVTGRRQAWVRAEIARKCRLRAIAVEKQERIEPPGEG